MALLALWESNPTAVGKLRIEQIVVTAGNGHLVDDSDCSRELRSYLASIPLADLRKHAERCLDSKFERSGLVLQDIINEIGRRLGYSVTNGRYQGTKNSSGYDGLWKSPEGKAIVIEVKTTDAYRIKLQKLIDYRRVLHSDGHLGDTASVLIVVGRDDTGELEEQVRGSRYAWDIRLISVTALLKLAEVKEETDAPETANQIRTLLVPFDNTRLDGIIDVMFATTADVANPIDAEPPDGEEQPKSAPVERRIVTDREAIAKKRDQLLVTLSDLHSVPFIKNTRATYWDPTHELRAVCAVSKAYPDYGEYRYWYAYHPAWDEFLSGGKNGLIGWACLDLDVAFVMPRQKLYPLLSNMNQTIREEGRSYWHIKILRKADGHYYLHQPLGDDDVPLAPFTIELKKAE